MGIKTSVFGSTTERNYYHKLSRQWGEQFRIYHNLPFLNIFTTDNLFDFNSAQRIYLEQEDIERLKKTSVDFILCDESDRPVLCIEFDGLQQGFNVGTKYHSPQPSRRQNRWRQKITDLKLRVAWGSFVPLYVVYSSLVDDIAPEIKLTIVDGIIGENLANKAAHNRFAEDSIADYYGYSESDFDNLDPDTKDDLIQGYAIDVEVSAELDHNPIWQKSAELQQELGGFCSSYELRGVSIPDTSKAKSIHARINLIKNATLVGTKAILHSKQHGDIEAQIMMPDYDGVTAWTLTQEVALIVGFSELKRRVEHRNR